MARPREFDREEVLQRAMLTFWAKGYDGTSVSDLLEAMDISRSSMYESFGDKQSLFIESMNHYAKIIAPGKEVLHSESVSVREGFHAYFHERIRIAMHTEYPGGCFFINTATSMETADDRVKTAVRLHAERIESEFFGLLEDGKRRGEMDHNKDTRALARFFVGVVSGINVIARIQKDSAVLEDVVNTALKLLD